MGLSAEFAAVAALIIADVPDCEVMITAESLTWNGRPPRVVFELPMLGSEGFPAERVTRGYERGSGHKGIFLARECTFNAHCWIPGTTVTIGGVTMEVPDDNEDPAVGALWLPHYVMNAFQTRWAGGWEMVGAGWADRTSLNEGFVYVLTARVTFPVYRENTGLTTATISSYVDTLEIT